jgi:hypothetical protein
VENTTSVLERSMKFSSSRATTAAHLSWQSPAWADSTSSSHVTGLAVAAAAEADAPREGVASPKGKARLEAAKRGLAQVDRGPAGDADWGLVRLWARRVADAELALCCRPAERKAALEALVRRARDTEQVVRAVSKTGAVSQVELLEAEFFRADAEALMADEEARQADGG